MVEGPETMKSKEASVGKNDLSKRKGKEDKQPTKVVIRKLPPNVTENSFLEFTSPLFEHDYFYYVQDENPSFGDQSFSRAYINFINVHDVYSFTQKFDDYVFIDDTGQEYPAVVEYAPFQRIPKNRGNRRSDSLCGTIEEDSDYMEFVQQLESEIQDHKTSQITEHYFDLANDDNEEKVTTTPLIEFLTSRKNEYIKYKEEKKEERRRRDTERKKFKEENRRIKKEKEAVKAKIVEKSKEEKKTQDGKIFEELTSSGSRVRGKSYQEERQRDLARRKLDEKCSKVDDNKENSKSVTTEKSENECEKSPEDNDLVKTQARANYKDGEFNKKSLEDKKSHHEEDRKSHYHSRDKEDKKHFYGVKKREFVGGYDYDGKYNKSSKSGNYYYDDYKSKSHSSYQKNAFVSNKFGKSKEYYEEKNSKHYDGKSKKYEHADYKDRKNHKEYDKKHVSKTGDSALNLEVKTDKPVKKSESNDREINNASKPERMSRSSSKDNDNHSGSTSEIEGSKSKDTRKEIKENDPRAERRIKNKDRPALEIYRPGMGKFSRQRLERNKSNESKDCD
ncbi:regulator of nonsense transcripts 3B [Planococcus citri]|uniref:regulator of nonsense transcripts 3B n=1 Tax=Planococcus citri TaxID=170843 RepID=UPI0031F74A6E